MKFADDRHSVAPRKLTAEAVPRPSLQDFQPSPGLGRWSPEQLRVWLPLSLYQQPLHCFPAEHPGFVWPWGDSASPVFNPPTKTLPFPPLPGAQPLPRFEHTEETDSGLRASPFPAPSGLCGTILCDGRARPPSSKASSPAPCR